MPKMPSRLTPRSPKTTGKARQDGMDFIVIGAGGAIEFAVLKSEAVGLDPTPKRGHSRVQRRANRFSTFLRHWFESCSGSFIIFHHVASCSSKSTGYVKNTSIFRECTPHHQGGKFHHVAAFSLQAHFKRVLPAQDRWADPVNEL